MVLFVSPSNTTSSSWQFEMNLWQMRLFIRGGGNSYQQDKYSDIKASQTVGKGRESPLALVGDLFSDDATIKILGFCAVCSLVSGRASGL